MTTTDNYEQELNRIREELHKESKGYTQQEWIDKVNRDANAILAQYGLKLAA